MMATHPVPETHAPTPVGCRTLCQYPGCGQPIELIPPAGPPSPVDHPVWAHIVVGTWVGPDHAATPVEQPEPAGEPELPELVPGTRLCWDCKYEEMDDHPRCGVAGCHCSGCIPPPEPEPEPARQLIAEIVASYHQHRAARASRLRPVNPYDVERMAHRMADAAQDRLRYTFHPGQDSPEYRRAVAAHQRRVWALRRLAEALARQAGGEQR